MGAVEFVAVLSCTLFTGAAVYISLVEHPVRMGCDTRTAASVWAPSYRRATVMQASLAVLSFLTGASAWLLSGSLIWLTGAVVIGLVVPFTFIAIMLTNHQLLEPGPDLASDETRELLEKRGRLHAVRSMPSLTASAIYLVSLIRAWDRGKGAGCKRRHFWESNRKLTACFCPVLPLCFRR